jgi:hypothetical protein
VARGDKQLVACARQQLGQAAADAAGADHADFQRRGLGARMSLQGKRQGEGAAGEDQRAAPGQEVLVRVHRAVPVSGKAGQRG